MAFSSFSELPHHLRYLAPRSEPRDAIDRTFKNTGFFTRYFDLLPDKFSGTEPSNFCVRDVELLIRLLLSLWLSDITVARQIFATLDAVLLPQLQQQRVEVPNGENRILQRPFRL
ncbi:hypothetical protein QUB70_12450 [Microcoleus sp. A003_D6]|uniref:hypothetical protein n=1 Tax=Microcoleus sp. A003_D6 TaxID=3055266 RepID=UPI002FD5CD40